MKSGDLVTEVVDGQAQTFLEENARLPAELLLRARVVQRDAVHVAFALRTAARLHLVLGQERELAKEVVDRHRNASADVIGPAVTLVQGRDVGHRYVADVKHVARLVAVPIDGQWLALDHAAGKDRDDAALFGEEILARAVD